MKTIIFLTILLSSLVWGQWEPRPINIQLLYHKCDTTSSYYKSDTTYYDWIIYRTDGIMHADSGYCVKTGWGNDMVSGFFTQYELKWWVWRGEVEIDEYYTCIKPHLRQVNLKDIWRTERKR